MTIRDRPAKHILPNQGDYELMVYGYRECYPHLVWIEIVHLPTGLVVKESSLLGDECLATQSNTMFKRLVQLVKQEIPA